MISQITGQVKKLTESSVTLFLNGLYYELMIPSGLHSQLKNAASNGSEISLFTLHFIEAGDRKSYHYPRLVGFTEQIDKEFFQVFTTVPGLGIKKALKSLTLPIKEIATAIENKNSATLSRLPGVGARLAEKIIAELSGKMARFALSKGEHSLTSVGKEESDLASEAVEVLLQLQYSKAVAEEMVQKALIANPKIKNSNALISAIFNQESGE